MTIPVTFFQAGATIIPTLLIALAVGAKRGEKYAEEMTEKKPSGLIAIVTVLILVLVAGVGEVTALIAIVFKAGSTFQAGLVFAAILFGIFMVGLELTRPLLTKTSTGVENLITSLLGAGFLIGLGVFIFAIGG
jgi:hypothetical protein